MTKGEVHARHDKAREKRLQHPSKAEIHAAHPAYGPAIHGSLTKGDAHAMHGNQAEAKLKSEGTDREK